MDKASIEFMRRKVNEFEKFIEQCNDPKQLFFLIEARDMFSQTLKDWERIVAQEDEENKLMMLKLIKDGKLTFELSGEEEFGTVTAFVVLKLDDIEIARESGIIMYIDTEGEGL